MIEKPKYEHDCDTCVFLGQYTNLRAYDLYYCPNGGPTVVARYGNEGSEYSSGLEIAQGLLSGKTAKHDGSWLKADDPYVQTHPLVHAYRRALNKNLIKL